MPREKENILPKNYSIDGKYKVLLFIKNSDNADTYRVKGEDGKVYFLKLLDYTKLHRTAFDSEGNLLEIELVQNLRHPNITRYKDDGEILINGKKYLYLILNFITGETLSERVSREPFTTLYDIKFIATGILAGLEYLHTQDNPVIHNEITIDNIMLDLSADVIKPQIIDFGYSRTFNQKSKSYNRAGLNPFYLAPECFNGYYSKQTDIFSVGVLIYQLIYGLPPWFKDISKFHAQMNKMEELIQEEREKKLEFPDVSDRIFDFDSNIIDVIKKALHQDADLRYKTANEFIHVLSGNMVLAGGDAEEKIGKKEIKTEKSKSSIRKDSGFGAIAGMDDLKDMLTVDVINAIKNPEEYSKYDISFPNGMLFWGPPRCGKTFFAKRFAEEVGYNYMEMPPSSLKSRFVNATQENIAKMFAEAEKNAPTVIFIDEINELVPNRESNIHEMAASAVNEMLAQMDRTGDKGIFVIGATNYPDKIDPAILGAGRLEKKFYIGPPDFELRKALFKKYLEKKPLDFGIDYDELAGITENYVTGDIEFLVNEAARKALVGKDRISMNLLKATIQKNKPSIALSELMKYLEMKKAMDGEANDDKNNDERKRIGFKP
jgi:transitional endoplasmic reticulum ATPase